MALCNFLTSDLFLKKPKVFSLFLCLKIFPVVNFNYNGFNHKEPAVETLIKVKKVVIVCDLSGKFGKTYCKDF